MDLDARYEKEDAMLEEELLSGLISQENYNNQLRQLQREYREYQQEECSCHGED